MADNESVGTKEPDVLMLVCPYCGEAFPSALQIDPPAFAAIQLENMRERCSACGHASRFAKSDYDFRRD